MASKTFNTRLQLKYDSYTNWSTNNPVLLAGEVAIAIVPSTTGNVKQVPATLMKVGDGTTAYNDLPFMSGLAANVHNWALAETKPVYNAEEIGGLADFVNTEVVDTNTTYQMVKVGDYEYKLQSKELGSDTWTDVANSTIVIPKYDDTQVKADIEALEQQVGEGTVATQIANAITALKLDETYDAKGSAATALTNAKAYTDELKNGAVAANADEITTIKGQIETINETITNNAGAATDAADQALVDAKAYTDELKNGAVKTAQDAADAAQADVDALKAKVGTVPENKTVVQMIADAQTAATYDDTQVKADIAANGKAISDMDAAYKAADAELQEAIDANAAAIGVLNGTEAGSVKKQVDDAIAAVVAEAPEDFDTLKEIADFITNDTTGAAALSNSIAENKKAVEQAQAEVDAVEIRMEDAEGKIQNLEADTHIHDNKELLDSYTQTEANLADAVAKKHDHANAAVLDGIDANDVSNWDAAKAGMDTLTAKVGTVPEDKTLVQMIADAQTAATYNDTQVKADIAANKEDIADHETRVATLEQKALLDGDTLVLNCGTSVIA